MAEKQRGKPTTSQLLTMIRGASTFEEATEYHRSAQDPRFHDYLFQLMEERGTSAKEVIRQSGIERSYFYHILSGAKNPGRNMVLRIGLCLRTSLKEMNQLLRLAGLSELYSRRRRDAVLIYAVTHQKSMEEANALLQEAQEERLYQDEHERRTDF